MPEVVNISGLDEITEDEAEEFDMDIDEYKEDGASGVAIVRGANGYSITVPIRKAEDGGTSVDEDSLYWEWKNPAAPIEKASLSPSIVMESDGEIIFHGYIEGGKWVPA